MIEISRFGHFIFSNMHQCIEYNAVESCSCERSVRTSHFRNRLFCVIFRREIGDDCELRSSCKISGDLSRGRDISTSSQYERRLGDKHYATPRPRYAGRITGWSMLVVLLSSLYGIYSAEFIPSVLTVRIGIFAGAVIAAIGVFFQLRWTRNSDRPAKWKDSLFVQVPLTIFLGFIFGWTAFGIGLPSMYSAVWGVRESRQAKVTGWNYRNRYHCAGPQLDSRVFGNPCMVRQIPRGMIVTLLGRQSVLGFQILGISTPDF
jgi:hypothetical protein